MAYYYKENRGIGQHVDVSMQESITLTPFFAVETWELQKRNVSRTGGYMAVSRPEPLGLLRHRTVWPCKDGFVCMMLVGGGHKGNVNSSTELVKYAVSQGMALELKDYDWSTMDVSTISQEERTHIEDILMPFMLSKTKKELHEIAIEKGILLMPVNKISDLFESQQLLARNYWVKVEHPELADSITYPGAPYKFNEGKWNIWRRAPLIGEHNEEIYMMEMGFSKEEVLLLRANNVI
jgi:crotonobetainyl-CoA:carnitine CoA-transferase CaiB-like acyl-CoA transferase